MTPRVAEYRKKNDDKEEVIGEIKKPGPSSEQSHRDSEQELHDSNLRINSKPDTRWNLEGFGTAAIVRTNVLWDGTPMSLSFKWFRMLRNPSDVKPTV
jgi:hypothetical protein